MGTKICEFSSHQILRVLIINNCNVLIITNSYVMKLIIARIKNYDFTIYAQNNASSE